MNRFSSEIKSQTVYIKLVTGLHLNVFCPAYFLCENSTVLQMQIWYYMKDLGVFVCLRALRQKTRPMF